MAFVDTILGESTLTTLAVHPNARRRGIAEVWGGGATQPPNTLLFCSASCVSTRAHQGCIPVHNPFFIGVFIGVSYLYFARSLFWRENFGGRNRGLNHVEKVWARDIERRRIYIYAKDGYIQYMPTYLKKCICSHAGAVERVPHAFGRGRKLPFHARGEIKARIRHM